MSISDQAGPVCAERIGVARLAKMAFDGIDLTPLWHQLVPKATGNPAAAGIGMDLSVIAQLLGDQKTGLAIQHEVLQRQRLFRSPCAAPVPGLRVLALAAEMDMGSNTPIEFLIQDSDIELTTLYVVPGTAMPNPLPAHDVAIVVAPDDDRTKAALGEIERLADAWPAPLLNPPERIGQLDRDRLHRLLSPVQGLQIPMTARLSRRDLVELCENPASLGERLQGGAFPLIVRPVGSHAGLGLGKIDSPDEIADYLASRPEAEFFLSPYVDYASADGLFRKYRLVCVGGRVYACHMAICDQWKIWYLNADMSADGAKRAEEAHFMASFDHGFAARHAGALSGMMARLGLDYFMVDCAETKTGELLVFEADNTAIVHCMDSPTLFPYKAPQMRKIFDAFAAMLYSRAGKAKARAA